MNRKKASRLINQVASAIARSIDRKAPGDHVPDRIAMPMLDKLEKQQQQLESAVCAIQGLIEIYLEEETDEETAGAKTV